jgi:hypothetical protein
MSQSQEISVISVIEPIPDFPTYDEVASYFYDLLYSSSRNTRSSNNGATEPNNGICFGCGEKAYLGKNFLPSISHKCSDIRKNN